MSSVSRPSTSTGDLLTRRGDLAPDPVPAPSRALAPDAIRMLRCWCDPQHRPSTWADPSFQAAVESVRRHLAPVRSRRSLASSFAREAFHRSDDAGDPVRVAYALRWQELGLD